MQDFAMINHNKVFTPGFSLQMYDFFQYRQNLNSEKLTLHQMAALGLYSSFFVVVNVVNLLLVFFLCYTAFHEFY